VSTVHVVVPAGLDDPSRPSGGNAYDRRICRDLAAAGWDVVEHAAPGSWPSPDAAAEQALAQVVRAIPDGAVVLVDGLVASAVPAVLVCEVDRLRLVALVHMLLDHVALDAGPPGREARDARSGEGAVLSAVDHVITTSAWTRDQLLARYALAPDRVHVAEPGVDPAPLAPGTTGGRALLCVGVVAHHKGQDVLLAALATAADLPWRCTCVGALDREPDFVDEVRHSLRAAGIADRVVFPGPRVGAALADAYADADVLVVASRAEAYGMVVTEALARGLPVVATAVGGVPEALGRARDGCRPGLLVPPGDTAALAAALRDWLVDADLRRRLREAARGRRSTLAGWDVPVSRIGQVLDRAAAR
jgi:glycosyltransferase involved in cell wall biosynthesis